MKFGYVKLSHEKAHRLCLNIRKSINSRLQEHFKNVEIWFRQNLIV